LILIDKSPSMVYSLDSMRRAYRFFPQARFIHLARHPRGYCESVLNYLHTLTTPEYQPREEERDVGETPEWIINLASYPFLPDQDASGQDTREIDPQGGWLTLNTNISTFLKSISSDQWIAIRGEDLVREPTGVVTKVAQWLELRADSEAVDQMAHPERSSFACFGPPSARLGNDIFFLEKPALQPGRAEPRSLSGPLNWRPDGQQFLPEVIELAHYLGYQ
jgi:hypothetical protein